MSNALAISGVTAILQYYLNNLYVSVSAQFPSQVTVSCLAPDQVQKLLSGSGNAENQVNLFLHQVTHNAAWRNVDLASMSAGGSERLKSPPLALNLHYLLTAYGSDFWQSEALLGYALMMLHEAPMLTRNDIANALTMLTNPPFPIPVPYPGNPLTNFIGFSGLADQIEMIKIVPETLGREEMAWLWTALKADYRTTFPFQVSVVLMQPAQQTSFALPVLYRNLSAKPVQPARVIEVMPPAHQSAAQPGDTVTVTGEFLIGATRVVLSSPRFGVQLTPTVTTSTGTSLTFVLPPDISQYPVGVYDLSVQFLDSTLTLVQQTTNSLPIAVAPMLPTQVATTVANPHGKLVTVNTFSPQAWEGQDISLALSTLAAPIVNMSAKAQPFAGKVAALSFQFGPGLPVGALLGRLVFDGVASQVQVNWNVFPPVFQGPMVTV
jgi:hypothetical protein